MSSDLLITTFIPLPRRDGNQTVMTSYRFHSADVLRTLPGTRGGTGHEGEIQGEQKAE